MNRTSRDPEKKQLRLKNQKSVNHPTLGFIHTFGEKAFRDVKERQKLFRGRRRDYLLNTRNDTQIKALNHYKRKTKVPVLPRALKSA